MLLTVDNLTLHVEDRGSGMPLIVVHGGLGLDHTYFRPYLDDLASDCRVTYVDLRGHGESSGAESLAGASLDTLVDDLRGVIASLGLERATLLGHSYGGFIALRFALRHPDALAGLILCSTAASMGHAGAALEIARQRAAAPVLAALTGAFAGPVESDADFARLWTTIAPLYFHDASLALRPFERTRYSAAGYNFGTFVGLRDYDVSGQLDRIRADTLVLSGAEDWLMPPHLAGDVLARGIAGAGHHVFPASGHFPFVEEPAAFLDVVRSWISARGRAAA